MKNLTRHHAWLAIGVILVVWNVFQLIVGIATLQIAAIFWGLVGLAIGLLISHQSLEYFGGWRYQWHKFINTFKIKRKPNIKNKMRGKQNTTGDVVDLNSRRKLH